MTLQTRDNKERLARIKRDQSILIDSLIMQGLNAARAVNARLSIWADKDGEIMDIVEWLSDGAPEEKDEEETDDE